MGQRPIAIRVRTKAEGLRSGSVETHARGGSFAANNTPPGAAEGMLKKYTSVESETVCSINEAAMRLGVSERTIFRLLKTGELERVEPDVDLDGIDQKNVNQPNSGIFMSDTINSNRPRSKPKYHSLSFKMSDKYDNMTDNNVINKLLYEQITEKDIQISHLLRSQQDMAQTIKRLQEQMFELAHLVLSHSVAAAQAKTESELKAQEQSSCRGLANLISSKNRK